MNVFRDERKRIRTIGKQGILKIQKENKRNCNRRRKQGRKYKLGDLVAIKGTQFVQGKFKAKFLVPYKIPSVKENDRYDVKKGVKWKTITSTGAMDYLHRYFRE